MTISDGKSQPFLARSVRSNDLDEFSAMIPGGTFGAVALADQKAFSATVRIVDFGRGLYLRSVQTLGAVGIRSSFENEDEETITYLFPAFGSPGLAMDGRDVDPGQIITRQRGDTPYFRTSGPQEMSVLIVRPDILLRTLSAFSGKDRLRLLQAPAQSGAIEPGRLSRLKSRHRELTRLQQDWELGDTARTARAVEIVRGEITSLVADALLSGETRVDHKARQLQTHSMARIERFIDETRGSAAGLQEMCEATGLALRTVEAITRDRTGMSAQAYFRCRRLGFAREELLAPARATSVTEVALHNGFAHFGRFAAYYRQAYGETPSETLRRATR
jgi:AraC-like DNA-binding protein